MKILAAKVYHDRQYMNPPTLQVLVDRIPARENFIYQKKEADDHILYFAECKGIVHFNSYTPKNENGYGGAVFSYTLEDGTIETRKGPWSSSPSYMNKYFPTSVDVSYTDNKEAFERGYTFTGGHITLEKAIEAANLVEGYTLTELHKYGSTLWELVEGK